MAKLPDQIVTIHCDTSELDAALVKLRELAAVTERLAGSPEAATLLAGAAIAISTATPTKISRRKLLTWWHP